MQYTYTYCTIERLGVNDRQLRPYCARWSDFSVAKNFLRGSTIINTFNKASSALKFKGRCAHGGKKRHLGVYFNPTSRSRSPIECCRPDRRTEWATSSRRRLLFVIYMKRYKHKGKVSLHRLIELNSVWISSVGTNQVEVEHVESCSYHLGLDHQRKKCPISFTKQ